MGGIHCICHPSAKGSESRSLGAAVIQLSASCSVAESMNEMHEPFESRRSTVSVVLRLRVMSIDCEFQSFGSKTCTSIEFFSIVRMRLSVYCADCEHPRSHPCTFSFSSTLPDSRTLSFTPRSMNTHPEYVLRTCSRPLTSGQRERYNDDRYSSRLSLLRRSAAVKECRVIHRVSSRSFRVEKWQHDVDRVSGSIIGAILSSCACVRRSIPWGVPTQPFHLNEQHHSFVLSPCTNPTFVQYILRAHISIEPQIHPD